MLAYCGRCWGGCRWAVGLEAGGDRGDDYRYEHWGGLYRPLGARCVVGGAAWPFGARDLRLFGGGDSLCGDCLCGRVVMRVVRWVISWLRSWAGDRVSGGFISFRCFVLFSYDRYPDICHLVGSFPQRRVYLADFCGVKHGGLEGRCVGVYVLESGGVEVPKP